jgi:uncharacterized RDD family membrane protein YckC
MTVHGNDGLPDGPDGPGGTGTADIDDYARRFEQHLPGPAHERARSRAELVEHLSDAADAGELPAAMERLGSPEQAAATFSRFRSAPAAEVADRLLAALLDHLPFVAVTVAILVNGIVGAATSAQGFAMTLPPFVAVEIGGVCVSPAPIQCDNAQYEAAGLLATLGIPLALAWSILGVGLIEARTGTTPGKRLRGLRVVTDAGLRVPAGTAVARRLSLLAGPLVWVDWAPVLWGEPRRLLDLATGTRVVVADPAVSRAADEAAEAS